MFNLTGIDIHRIAIWEIYSLAKVFGEEEKTLKVNVARQQECSYGMIRKPIYGIHNQLALS